MLVITTIISFLEYCSSFLTDTLFSCSSVVCFPHNSQSHYLKISRIMLFSYSKYSNSFPQNSLLFTMSYRFFSDLISYYFPCHSFPLSDTNLSVFFQKPYLVSTSALANLKTFFISCF